MSEKDIADGYSDEDMDFAGLSEEERAALRGEDEGDESREDQDADQDQDGEAEESDAEESEADADADADADPASEQEGDEPKAEADEKDPFVPQYKLDAEQEGQSEAHEAALQALDAKFEEGDLSASEYRKAVAELNNPVLIEQAKRAAMEEISKQNAAQLWERQQEEFFSAYPDYRDSTIKFAGLDAALKELYADEANTSKTGAWFLREAKQRVDRELGIQAPPPADAGPRPKPELPANLGDLPRADRETSNDKYSSLDNLEGLELEQALARMSDSELEAFGNTR